MQFFSLQNWKALTAEEKKQHSLFNCQRCNEDLVYKSKLDLFKNVANPFKGKAFKAEFHQASDAVATAQDDKRKQKQRNKIGKEFGTRRTFGQKRC